MERRSLVGLLMIFFMLGTAVGALTVVSLWQTSMSMTLVPYAEDDFHIELWDEYGDPLTDYDWGEFNPGESKSLNITVAYLGTVALANVTWNATDLPEGWSISVWTPTVPEYIWPENQVWLMDTGDTFPLRIRLTEAGAIENTPYSFTLNWMAGPP